MKSYEKQGFSLSVQTVEQTTPRFQLIVYGSTLFQMKHRLHQAFCK